jgi:broad specificity phosphatase PhoE
MLGDCDYGTWKGYSFSDVRAREPDAVSDWLYDPTAVPHSGEPLSSLTQRVAQWLDAANMMEQRAILITHAYHPRGNCARD